jgi:multiple sugar transport system permease protein
LLPSEFAWENFARVFDSDIPMAAFIANSLIVSLTSVVGVTLSSALVAFGFARLRAPGKNALFVVLLATMMIPVEVLLIPQFVIFRQLGWIDTLLPLIVPNFFAHAYNVFLMRQFIARIPLELDEAAMLDGLGMFGVFRRIVLPLMTPVLVAVAIFTFTSTWGNFLGPLIYINTPERMPLALGIQVFSASSAGAQLPPWNLVMVGAMFLTIPPLITYYFGQKHLYESGLVAGTAGVK